MKKLTPQLRELEILTTSSAPGVSRHHLGTDFDFGRSSRDLINDVWKSNGFYAGTYNWLADNGSRFGFIQPFTPESGGYGKGYTEERWHWSYYPIAQALLEFADRHRDKIASKLYDRWENGKKGTPGYRYNFISDSWGKYMFNVGTKASFKP